jgi:acid phosphatase (class A)
MKRRLLIYPVLIVVAVGVSLSFWRHTEFIAPGDIDFKALLDPPPAVNSDAGRRDIEEVLRLQASRSAQDIERAKSEIDLWPFVFARVLGPGFSSDNLPNTTVFLREVMNEDAAIVDQAKIFYARRRPFAVDPRVKPCIATEDTFSYPSGHATNSMLLALVLGEMFPDRRDALLAEAEQIGQDRVLAGVHYPTDVKAGQTLAKAIFDSMRRSGRFNERLESAKAEWAARLHASRN